MKTIHPSFISENNTRLFVEQTMNRMIRKNPKITGDKCYWLYYYVKSDYDLILNSLWNYDLSGDFLGFPNQQRVIRHQIEAFLDLFNLSCDREYMNVLHLNNKEKRNPGSYGKYLGASSFFSSVQKLKIARDNGFQYLKYLEVFSVNANRYVHPNVFMEPLSEAEKDDLIRRLINVSIFLVAEAFRVMTRIYADEAEAVHLNCNLCECEQGECDCMQCIEKFITEDRYFVDTSDNLFSILYDDSATL